MINTPKHNERYNMISFVCRAGKNFTSTIVNSVLKHVAVRVIDSNVGTIRNQYVAGVWNTIPYVAKIGNEKIIIIQDV